MKRRKRILRLIATAVVLLIICVFVCGVTAIKNTVTAKEIPDRMTYTLFLGDTLWELYEDFGSGITWERWYEEMKEENGKEYGEEWYAGEEITILIYK